MDQFFGFAQELLEKKRAQLADPYAHVELYDLLNPKLRDDQFYVQFAQERGGRVLDLACGSGRLLPLLLDAGLDVAGLDLSPAMLERARSRLGERAGQVELVLGDMRSFTFDRPFRTIIIPYCSMIYMHTDADRLAVLRRCYQHLEEDGWLAFDFLAGQVEPGEGLPTLALQGIHPFTGELLVSVVQIKGLSQDLRLLNQINYVLPESPGQARVTVYASKEAVIDPEHMASLLVQAGFAVEGVYSSSALEAYDGREECLIMARKRRG
jgi:SAM-dependent methyltransferase